MEARLPTEIWVKAHLRRCQIDGMPVYIVHRGDRTGGSVMVKINQYEHGCRVLSQVRDIEGKLVWMGAFRNALVPEAEADAYIQRAIARDPDLWALEIEDRLGRHPFEGTVL